MKKTVLLSVFFFVAVSLVSAQVNKETKKDLPIKEAAGVEQVQAVAKTASGSGTNSTQAVNVVTYDFTVAGAAYTTGPAPMVEVATGVWAMIAGDTNGSGIISNSDKDAVINDLNLAGYYPGDTNFSGIVSNSDKDFIIQNLNKSTQVP